MDCGTYDEVTTSTDEREREREREREIIGLWGNFERKKKS
jgi:hypothetical protein